MRQPAYHTHKDGTYTLDEKYQGKTAIMGLNIKADSWVLLPNGDMILDVGFRWNGPDVVLDHPLLMMPSALHDAGCYGLKQGLIPASQAKQVHFTYRDAMKTWGVPKVRRVVQFRAVRHGHGIYAKVMGWLGK